MQLLPALVVSLFAGQPQVDACARARSLYEALALDEALALATDALERGGERRPACLEARALTLTVLGRLAEAERAWVELFGVAPDHLVRDPSLSPSQLDTIERIRERLRPLEARLKARWLAHDALRVEVFLEGSLGEARRVRVAVEPLGQALASPLAAEVLLTGRVATATVAVPPGVELAQTQLSGRVLGAGERVLLEFGTEVMLTQRPAAVIAAEPPGAGVSWLVWAGVGVAVIGAAAAVTLLVQPGSPACTGLGCVGVDP